jgi:CRISPR-associated exonuclease Cas4
MYTDSDLVLISALEHWAYCPRQCALIHVEQTFDENIYTLRGRMEHERAHEEAVEWQGETRIERALPLWSKRLGLVGKADVVEFHGDAPYPVEYKHGARRQRLAADMQLCAQALCLEEMIGQEVPKGAIFHQASRRRREVIFDESLRRQVEEAVVAVRGLLASTQLPAAVNDARCPECSLIESCMPSVVAQPLRPAALRARLFRVEEPLASLGGPQTGNRQSERK